MKNAAGCLGVTLTLAGAFGAPAVGHAQTVQGQLIDAIEGNPIAYAFVILRDATDREVLRVLTDQQGSFFIEAPGTGRYRLQTAIIGWRSWTSPLFTLAEGETFTYLMEVPLEAIRLDALIVEGVHECEIDPDSGNAVSVLWEEAQKALEAVTWTQATGQLQYQAIEFHRDLHPETLRSLGGHANRQSGMSTGSPFTSVPAEQLSARGYIQEAGEGFRPYGPDADVLLSESFANDHCFIIQPHPDEPNLIGLGFQPVRSREIPDIQGVMWLDKKTAQLRSLEFRYDRLPWPVSLRHAGGKIDFEQLPTGLWFVSEWRLRMPRLERSTHGITLGQYRVRSYSETGGYVVELRRQDGSPMPRFGTATFDVVVDSAAGSVNVDGVLPNGIAGAITDVLNGATIGGALVLLLDPARTIRGVTLSGSTGTFAVRPPNAGSYSIAVRRIGYRPTASALVDIPAGIVIRTRVNLRESESGDAERDDASRRQFGDVIPQFRFFREEIDRTGAGSVFELALTINGVRAVGALLDRPVLLLNDHACTPSVYLDGHPSATSRVLHTPFKTWVNAVEFSLSPDDTPQEHLADDPDVAKCGTILIWSAAR